MGGNSGHQHTEAGADRYRKFFDSAALSMAVLEPDGSISEANRSFLALTGLSAGDLHGTRIEWLFHAGDSPALENGLAALFSGLLPEDRFLREARLAAPEAAETWVSLHASLVRDCHGNILYALVQFLDITAAKALERQISTIAKEWTATFDAMSDMVLINGADHTVSRANKSMASFLMKHPRDLVGRKCHELVHDTDEPWHHCPHSAAMEKERPVTAVVDDKAVGVPLLVTCSPYYDREGRLAGTIHVARNISEQRALEDAREQLIAELQQAVSEVRMLTGLLPICSSCKKIRGENGDWQRIEQYISERSQATFSHGICPDCASDLYPEFCEK